MHNFFISHWILYQVERSSNYFDGLLRVVDDEKPFKLDSSRGDLQSGVLGREKLSLVHTRQEPI